MTSEVAASPVATDDVHNLFFAVRPDAEARSRLVDARQGHIESCGMAGNAVPPECLHVTLHRLGDHDGMPHDLIERAKAAGARVEMAPFDVGFVRIGSPGAAGIGGLALTGSGELKSLRQLQRALATTMQAAGIGHLVRRHFNPHVTLLYGPQRVLREPIAPIRWRVDELVLIDTLVGSTRHADLAVWPLRSLQMSFADW